MTDRGTPCRVIVRIGGKKLVRDVLLGAERAALGPETLIGEAVRGVVGPRVAVTVAPDEASKS